MRKSQRCMLTRAKERRPLKARLRLLYSGVARVLELARMTLGAALASLNFWKAMEPFKDVINVSGSRARAASAIAFALLGPASIAS